MKKFKIPALIPTLSLLLVTTLNIANADLNEDNPVPFLPPFQHYRSLSVAAITTTTTTTSTTYEPIPGETASEFKRTELWSQESI
jgi:hypothetical protein